MGMNVQELKHAEKLQEWSARVAECRSSGIGVKAWCAANGIALKTYYNWERQIVKAATRQYALPAPIQSGQLIRVNPDSMPGQGNRLLRKYYNILQFYYQKELWRKCQSNQEGGDCFDKGRTENIS